MHYPPEPFLIRMIKPIRLISSEDRRKAIRAAGHNVFALKAEDIFIDLQTDSSTGAMSFRQWSAIMQDNERVSRGVRSSRLQERENIQNRKE